VTGRTLRLIRTSISSSMSLLAARIITSRKFALIYALDSY
jgi:hypothetical protein